MMRGQTEQGRETSQTAGVYMYIRLMSWIIDRIETTCSTTTNSQT
jgi:hypothetical protein